MASRFKLARAGAGFVGAAVVLVMGAAIPANADPVEGRVDGGALGLNVDVGDGFENDISTQLIGLTLDDGTQLDTYCVEIDQALDRSQALLEKDLDDFPNQASPFNENEDKINFILQNGFPVKSTKQLGKVLTNKGTALNDGSLSVEEAVAGTQAAIWHFSDRTDLNQQDPVPGDARSGADVFALYDFLIGPDNVGVSDQPEAALQVLPDLRSGSAGDRIGPFTVRTSGDIQKLQTDLPDGVRITDAEGRQLRANQIVNGSKLFFDVPDDQDADKASFTLTGTAAVETGRLFVPEDYLEGNPAQSLIVASAEASELTAEANATWGADDNEAPPVAQGKNDQDFNDDDLAETGASIMLPVAIGAGLLVAGGAALLFLRVIRRRSSNS